MNRRRIILFGLLCLQRLLAFSNAEELNQSLRGATLAPTLDPTLMPTSPPTSATLNPKIVSAISKSKANKLQAVLNHFRAKVNPPAAGMRYSYWNASLAADLLNWQARVAPGSLFEKVNLPGPKGLGNSSFLGFNLMQMAPFAEKYPGFGFLVHDTFVTPEKMVYNFQFRIRQVPDCIRFVQCDENQWTNFETCGHPLVQVPGEHCSWATQYTPRFAMETLDSFACVIFKQHGPNAPAAQKWSYFCYGNYKQSNPRNDVPYMVGHRCSQCSQEAKKCYKNALCY